MLGLISSCWVVFGYVRLGCVALFEVRLSWVALGCFREGCVGLC